MRQANIKLGGGFSSNEKLEKYAELVGGIYGGGEYAVPESDLLSIDPGVANSILVIGARGSVAGKEKPIELHSASTVEVELRNLFQFPKRSNKVPKIKKQKLRKRKTKKGGDDVPVDPVHASTSGVVKLRDVADQDIPKLLQNTSSGENLEPAKPIDDYLIAEEIDAQMKNTSGSESSEDESSTSSDDESSEDESNEDKSGKNGNLSPKQSPKQSPVASPHASPRISSHTPAHTSTHHSPKHSRAGSPHLSPHASPHVSPKMSPKPSVTLQDNIANTNTVPEDIEIAHDTGGDDLNIFHAIAN